MRRPARLGLPGAACATALGHAPLAPFPGTGTRPVPDLAASHSAVFICEEHQAFTLIRQRRAIPVVATQSISSLRSVLPGSEAWRTLVQTLRIRIYPSPGDGSSARIASETGRSVPTTQPSCTFTETTGRAEFSLLSGRAGGERGTIGAGTSFRPAKEPVFPLRDFALLANDQAICLPGDGAESLAPQRVCPHERGPAPIAEPLWRVCREAERIIEEGGVPVRPVAGDRADYSLNRNEIVLPARGQFPSAHRYDQTALHELGQSTGAPERMNRATLTVGMSEGFGSPAHAKEELRSEVSAMTTGERVGVGHGPCRGAACVEARVAALKEDPREIRRAAADARKISDFVLARSRERASGRAPAPVAATRPTAPLTVSERSFDLGR